MKNAGWIDHEGTPAFHLTALERLGGVSALFTGRRGGVSPRWNGGLNWSLSVGDEPAHVHENRRRSLALLGLQADRAVMAGLVHGDRVVAVTQHDMGAGPGEVAMRPDCDALITDLPAIALIITAADCVPVYLYDPVRRVIGVAHAGWRGTVAGIAGKTALAMAERYGCRPADIVAGIGPSIGPCCYEVDDLVAVPLRRHYGADSERLLLPGRGEGKYQLDLWAANEQDLRRAGVGQLFTADVCTACGVDRLFSHRAEAGAAGRGAALIALSR